MTGWVMEDDWDAVQVGQRVRLEHVGANMFCEVTVDASVLATERAIGARGAYWRGSDGWTLFVESRPVPALPTEPGVYADSRGFPWGLNHAGKWSDFEGGKYADRLGYVDNPTIFGPFIRLEPVPVTAKKVLDRIAECVAVINADDLKWIENYVLPQVREEFGVTND